jgi:diacylglycerol kinase
MVTIMVVIAGLMLKVSGIEWSILIGFIALVLSLELVNTSIEKLVDLISPDYHQQAGLVKDISAGAVLIAAIAAVIAGLTIFLPKVV